MILFTQAHYTKPLDNEYFYFTENSHCIQVIVTCKLVDVTSLNSYNR